MQVSGVEAPAEAEVGVSCNSVSDPARMCGLLGLLAGWKATLQPCPPGS